MKRISTVVAVVLVSVFVLVGFWGCKELKEIRVSLVESVGVESLGAYDNKVLMMFVYNSDEDFWINVFNFNNSRYLTYGQELPEENQTGVKYYVYQSEFSLSGWDAELGLMVMYPPFGGETKYLSKRDFWKAAKPIITQILKQKKPILDAMREAAIENGALKAPGKSV